MGSNLSVYSLVKAGLLHFPKKQEAEKRDGVFLSMWGEAR